MSVFAHVEGLGQLLEQCVTDAVIAYRREFYPGRQTVDTIAEHLDEVQTQVLVRPGGVAIITVTCKGRRFNDHNVQCFRAQRGRMGSWKITASSLK